jgi:DNA mismatch endonuclease (patch repair protein)
VDQIEFTDQVFEIKTIMTDIFSKKKRSEIMSKVRSKDSKIEIEFRKKLWGAGFRYRKNSSKYFGKLDLVLPKYKTVIFIDSCFWHGCPKHGIIPETRKKFWKTKIERNKKRDKEVNWHYKKGSWKIIRIWEHNLKKIQCEEIKRAIICK